MRIFQNYNIKDFNTFHVNVRAEQFIVIETDSELIDLYNGNAFKNKFFILGSGSNVLFTKNFEGTIFKIDTKGIQVIKEDNDTISIEAEAGDDWDKFVEQTLKLKGYGLENLSLIPGSVGASVVQNIGAYGVEAKDFVESVEYFDLQDGKLHTMNRSDLKFTYRSSIFKHELKDKAIVTKVTYKLNKIPNLKVEYADIQNELQKRGLNVAQLNPNYLREMVIEIRLGKLHDPTEVGNAGSFFKNPIVEEKRALELQKQYPDLKLNYTDSEHVKLFAAWLIEKAGLKGWTSENGKYGISPKHALVIVNYKDSTGDEILSLVKRIQESVNSQFNIFLEPEVIII